MKRRNVIFSALAVTLSATMALAGCGGSGSSNSSNQTLKVFYQKTDGFKAFDIIAQKQKAVFEKAHPGVKVELQPVSAQESDYKTKLSLAQRSSETAPDVIYQDSDSLQADVDAGYLLNMQKYVDKWEDWKQFTPTAKNIGKGKDGFYGVPISTDTRVIWYNRQIFQKAGIAVPWQPKNWDEILQAARTIKKNVPGVIPMNMFIGTAVGEGTTMQSFDELLWGTGLGDNALSDRKTGKWVVGSKGFSDSLKFLKTIYDEKLTPEASEEFDPNIGTKISTELLPQGKMAMTVDGSWMPQTWVTKGSAGEWPQAREVMGIANFPTQHGQKPGFTTAAGGWNISISAKSQKPDLAFDFIKLLTSKESTIEFLTSSGNSTVRKDVAEDARYKNINPFMEDLSTSIQYAHFRPTVAEYTKISSEIQKATEKIATGTSAEEAAKAYDEAVIDIAGKDMTVTEK